MNCKPGQKKALYRKIKFLLLVAIIIFCLYQISSYVWNSYYNNKLNSELTELYLHDSQEAKTSETAKTGQSKKDNIVNFKELLSINSQVVGWIKIQDTNINYPVAKGEDNDYYLNHNIKKESSSSGSIFMDYRNKRSEEDLNTIIYGHNMKDGSMFKTLTSYKAKDFLIAHPIIELITLKKDTKWEIFSAHITDTDFNYIKMNFNSKKEYRTFLEELKNRSLYDTGVKVTDDDIILTLSTCTYEFYDARFVIHAKLLNEKR